MDIVNNTEIRVMAVKRSGMHAVMQWIANNAGGKRYILNDPCPYGNIFIDLRDSHFYQGNNIHELDIEKERRGEFSRKDSLIYNHENIDLSVLAGLEKGHDANIGKSAARYDVLVLRDPFNTLGSQLVRFYNRPDHFSARAYFKKLIELWKQCAREYLGLTRYLTNTRVLVNFNRWVSSEAERRAVAQKLGLTLKDNRINYVLSFGTGSSFDKKSFDGRAGHMKVLERFKHFLNDDFYRSFFDEEIFALSQEIFGQIPQTESLYPKPRPFLIRARAQARTTLKMAWLFIKLCLDSDKRNKIIRSKYAHLAQTFHDKLPSLYKFLRSAKRRLTGRKEQGGRE